MKLKSNTSSVYFLKKGSLYRKTVVWYKVYISLRPTTFIINIFLIWWIYNKIQTKTVVGFSCSLAYPGWLWSPPSLLSSAYKELFLQSNVAGMWSRLDMIRDLRFSWQWRLKLKQTSHLHLMPRTRICGNLLPQPHYASIVWFLGKEATSPLTFNKKK